jgi:penicillin-binding protein 1C
MNPLFRNVVKFCKAKLIGLKQWLWKHKVKSVCFFVSAVWYFLWLPSHLFTVDYSTVLVDTNNELLAAKIAQDGQWRFPMSDSVPYKFEQCIVQFEDAYFYKHLGINPFSIFKSIRRNVSAGKIKSGGSTITMQLARLIRHNQTRNYYQKIIEILLAVRIELSYTKNSILKHYAAHAPFGSNVVGLQAASWRYFGRDPHRLSWAESALLAVLPNAPSLIYPGKNQQQLLNKRNRLLKKLKDEDIIDESTYRLAIQEPLPDKPHPLPQLTPHLLAHSIQKYGQGKQYRTSIKRDLQMQVDELLNRQVQKLMPNQINNACALVCETESGKVLAYVGNSTAKGNAYENYVDVIQAPRSTGSILKPFLYAYLLSEHKMLPTSLLEDIPTQIGAYGPENYHMTYDGLVPANEALSRSLNIPAIKSLQDYGAARFHYRLKESGFTTFTKSSKHYGLSLILGGGEAKLWDVAGAYAWMGRVLQGYSDVSKGYRYTTFESLTFLNGEGISALEDHASDNTLRAGATWFTLKAMTELLRPQDYIGWMSFLSRNKIAWKTGTSFGFRDGWAVGVTPKYTVAVWVGNADGEGRPELTGTSAAAPLLFSIFNVLQNKTWFNKPINDMQTIMVCKESGYKASELCPNARLQTVQKEGHLTKLCPFHKEIFLDSSATYRVNSNCYPVSKMKAIAWFIATPTQEYYYKQRSVDYKPLPPYLPSCESEQSIKQMDLVYPRNDFKIYVPVDEKGLKSRCIFKATHKQKNVVLYWFMDEQCIGTTKDIHQLSVLPPKGRHKLTITDELGESVTCEFELVEKDEN